MACRLDLQTCSIRSGALNDDIGLHYLEYCRQTKRLIPFLH
jgi:hypothetical protein